MKLFALATAAALALTVPAFTTPAFAQADVKVKVNSGEGMTKKKVVIRQGGDVSRKKVVIRHGGDMTRRTVVIRHGDRGRHDGWRSRDAGNKTVIIKKRGEGGSKTVIKKKTFN